MCGRIQKIERAKNAITLVLKFRCELCGFESYIKTDFLVFRGDVCNPSNTHWEGLIGGNLDKDLKLYREMQYCKPCAVKAMQITKEHIKEETSDLKHEDFF